MDKFELQKLHDLPIEGVAERLGLQVVKHKALCPFHDDHHASLSFRKNKYRCWSCDAREDTISLVQKMLHKDFLEACRWLADGHNVILTEYRPKEDRPPKPFDAERFERYFEHPFLNAEARKFLFEERRLDERVVRWCRLTSWKDRRGVAWLQTPYFSRDGQLNRNLVKGVYPRFRFPQGSVCGIYNLPVLNLLRPGDDLAIFSVGIKSKLAATVEDFTPATNIRGYKLRARATGNFRKDVLNTMATIKEMDDYDGKLTP